MSTNENYLRALTVKIRLKIDITKRKKNNINNNDNNTFGLNLIDIGED